MAVVVAFVVLAVVFYVAVDVVAVIVVVSVATPLGIQRGKRHDCSIRHCYNLLRLHTPLEAAKQIKHRRCLRVPKTRRSPALLDGNKKYNAGNTGHKPSSETSGRGNTTKNGFKTFG